MQSIMRGMNNVQKSFNWISLLDFAEDYLNLAMTVGTVSVTVIVIML